MRRSTRRWRWHPPKKRRPTDALEEILAAEKEIGALQAKVEQQTALEVQRTEIERQVARLKTVGEEIERQSKELRRQEKRQATLAEQLSTTDQLEAERAKADSAVAELSTAIQDEREALAGLRISADKVKEQNAQLETIETPLCPVCEQPLTDSHRADLMERNAVQLDEMRAAYGGQQEQIKQKTEQLEATQKRLRNLNEQLRKLPRQSELDEVTQAIETFRAEIATLQTEVDGLSDSACPIARDSSPGKSAGQSTRTGCRGPGDRQPTRRN